MTTDPGLIPALDWWEWGTSRAQVRDGRGPERVVTDQPDPAHRPRPVGFLADLDAEPEEPSEIAAASVETDGDQA